MNILKTFRFSENLTHLFFLLSSHKFSSIAIATVVNFNEEKREKKKIKIRKPKCLEFKSIVITAAFLMTIVSFGQKKKNLINQVEKLKTQTAHLQANLDKIEKAKELNLEDELQYFSYSFGVTIANNLKAVGFDSLAYNAIAIAMEDAMKGKEKILPTDAQIKVQNTITDLQKRKAKEKSAEGELFLTENGKRSEVITTESGLQYEILNQGNGALPTAEDKVKVHYTGMFIGGEVFDSSVERGEPTTFGVTQVIKGWQEALQLMPVGSKWKIFIPQNLAYGERGAGGGSIPAYATLIFEMELLEIINVR